MSNNTQTYTGTSGNDTKTGDDGKPNVFESYGVGEDNLTGGSKDDVFKLTVDLNMDTINGKDGKDTVNYSGADRGLRIDLTNGSTTAVFSIDELFGREVDTDWWFGPTKFEKKVTDLNNIENVVGTKFNDVIKGDTHDNVIEGGAGADRIDGGNGSDTASYANSAKGVYVDLNGIKVGLPGLEVRLGINGWGGDATGDVLINIENLIGSKSNDTFVGNSGNNVFSGGVGDGNHGSDNFVFKGQIGHDVITDFDAVDDDRDYLVFDKAQFKDFEDFKAKTTWIDKGDDVLIKLDDYNTITLKDVELSNLDAREFKFVDMSSGFDWI